MQDSHGVIIASSGTVSTIAELQGQFVVGLQMPAGWDAASLTVQAARQGSDVFYTLYDEAGTAKTLVVDASRNIILDPADFMLASRVKLISSAMQTSERELFILIRYDE